MKRNAVKRARRRRPEAGRPVRTPELTIGDIMTTNLVTVSADQSLRETVDLFADRHLLAAPAVAAGKVVGVISASDILGFQASTPAVPTERPEQIEEAEWGPPTEWEEGGEPAAAFFTEMWADAGADVEERFERVQGPEWDVLGEHTVAEAMSRRIYNVPTAAAVPDAAAYMIRAGLHRLLVTEDGKFVGLVTMTDIVRAVADRRL